MAVTSLMAWAAIAREILVDYSDFSIGLDCHCLRIDGLITVISLLSLAAIARELTVLLL